MAKKRLTKADRRKMAESDRGIAGFIQTAAHFFGDMKDWIDGMEDGRHQSYITYPQRVLVSMGMLKNVCGVETLNQMNGKFNDSNCIRTLSLMSGNKRLDEMPDGDTLNHYLSLLPPDQLDGLRSKMIKSLIRSKLFYGERLLSKYWIVVIDGTGLFHFRERHCPHCLTARRAGEDGRERTSYYHKVVEAKLILGENLVLSIGTEFIENESETVAKQDCETKAAKRLMEKIKKEYPRLQICLLGDALFATEPVMNICKSHGWRYIFNLKEGAQPNIAGDYRWVKDGGGAAWKDNISGEKGRGCYVNHVEEVTGKAETFNVFEYFCPKEAPGGGTDETRFMWAIDIELKERNLEEMISRARSRWKIENEGFNNQKNGIYKIEHINSYDSNAMKNHYLLTQIADILMQLYLACNKLVKAIGQSIKNTSSLLLESFRRRFVTDEDVSFINKYTTVRLL
jgi:hypothetical protein